MSYIATVKVILAKQEKLNNGLYINYFSKQESIKSFYHRSLNRYLKSIEPILEIEYKYMQIVNAIKQQMRLWIRYRREGKEW